MESHHTGGSLLEGVMPVASDCVRRVCVESAQSKMWGWCGRIPAIGPVVQLTTITAWHGCWDLLLTEDLGVWMAPSLRLITLLVSVRHLMLLGPRTAGGGMSWPNNECSFDSRSSSTGHRVQHSVMEEACQCQPFCITCVISAQSWPCQDGRFVHAIATCRFLSFPMADLLSLNCIVPVPGQGCS